MDMLIHQTEMKKKLLEWPQYAHKQDGMASALSLRT